jgi:hypothetical protein
MFLLLEGKKSKKRKTTQNKTKQPCTFVVKLVPKDGKRSKIK